MLPAAQLAVRGSMVPAVLSSHRCACSGSASGRAPPALRSCGGLGRLRFARAGRRPRVAAVASGSAEQQEASAAQPAPSRVKQTMADLDALLGIVEEKPEAAQEQQQQGEGEQGERANISIAPEVLRALAEAEAQRAVGPGNGGPAQQEQQEVVERRVKDSIERIVEEAKRMADEQAGSGGEEGGSGGPAQGQGQPGAGAGNSLGEQALRRELANLAGMLAMRGGVDAEDLKKLKAGVFGPMSFWVTETRAEASAEGGLVVRGNLRGPREAVFAEVCAKTQELFGDRYVVRLILDPDSEGEPGADGEPRVAFEVLPTATALPPPTTGWQRAAAAVLLALTLGSTLQFGLAANIGLLPKETLQWLANPANLNTDVLPPGLESYDPTPFLSSAGRVFLATLLPQLAHELAHVIVAGAKGIQIGPSFLIPNSQLGTFGSVTQLKTMARNRSDLFDFAAAGLLAGGLASLLLFGVGLAVSSGGGGAEAGLIPVPAALFQGSLLLGGAAKLGLGADALARANVYVSPLLVGGWCGLVGTALNSLPVGNLDGGRLALSAYGKSVLAFSSLLAYIGLGLGLLGSSLALPFGLYVLICQRTSERFLQDEVSGVSEQRRLLAAGLFALAVLVLLPMAPEVADSMSVGTPSNFL